MDLQTLLLDRQIETTDRMRGQLVKLHDAAKPRAMPRSMDAYSNDCSAELAVYTAALIAAANAQIQYEASLQVASAAAQAYYQCQYGV